MAGRWLLVVARTIGLVKGVTVGSAGRKREAAGTEKPPMGGFSVRCIYLIPAEFW
jgi:hypothetical protein